VKILINLNIELPEGEDSLEFWAEFADRPVPRVGDAVQFDLMHDFEVERVQYTFPAGGAASSGPEVWLYCVQGEVEAQMGYTAVAYRKELARFAAISWDN
jgi:hypothetical protein